MKLNQYFQIGLTVNICEWYEFCIMAYLAPIIGHVFFGSNPSSLTAILQTYLVFAISYLFRPLGSIIFGLIADKKNSVTALKYSLYIMSIPTIIIAIIPSFNTIGYLAAWILICIKILHGIGAGGELPISAIYIYNQTSHSKNTIFFCSLANTGSLIGLLLASFIAYLLHITFNLDEINKWAWRIPFLLSIPLSLYVFYIRKRYIIDQNLEIPTSKSTKLIDHKTIKAFTIVFFLQTCFYIIFVWMPTYLTYFLHMNSQDSQLSNTIALITLVITTLSFGFIARYFAFERYIKSVMLCIIILIYPLLSILTNGSYPTIIVIQIICAILIGSLNGVIIYYLGRLFFDEVRFRNVAISFTVASAIAGGITPWLCSYVINATGLLSFPAIYIIVIGIISFISEYANI